MNSLSQIWGDILEYVRQNLIKSESSFNIWFKDLILYRLDNTTAYVAADSDYKMQIFNERYINDLKTAIKAVLGFEVEPVLFVCESGQDIDEQFSKRLSEMVDQIAEAEQQEQQQEQRPHTYQPAIPGRTNPDYTFDTFIVGSTNKFAYNACMNVAENPAVNYNPLYIYGPSGMGKTHLLYAIANKVKQLHPGANLLYVRGEDFVNELIDSLSTKKPMNYFREKYRTVDMILIDDIEFIAGKSTCQEEFFHTFNALHEDKKQIVLTSDLPPKEIKTLEDRLRTRFEWGLIVDIQPPDLELRVAILRNKARSYNTDIPNDVLMYLAQHVQNNIRQLEGAVRKLNAYSVLTNSVITIDTVRVLLKDIMTPETSPGFATDKIFEMVCARYGVPTEDILSSKRTSNVVHVRHIIIYYMRTLLDMTFPDIGKKMKLHHSSVMSAVENITGQMKEDPSFEMELTELGKDIDRTIKNG